MLINGIQIEGYMPINANPVVLSRQEYEEIMDKLKTANEKCRQYEALILNK